MIVSMTGFGDAAADVEGTHYAVEVRSLNNRYFKAVVKLPDAVSALEPEVESLLRKRLGRGSVTFALRLRIDSAAMAMSVNVPALNAYVAQLRSVQAAGVPTTIDLAVLLQLPGVLQDPAEEPDLVARHRGPVLDLAGRAIDRLIEFRRREGRALHDELMAHVGVIADNLEGVRARAPGVVDEYHKRLLSRVNELIGRAELRVAEADLIREVAVFAERTDIAEEIQRLRHHLDAFAHECGHGEQPGRRLDFIAQELLREANTIGSKANDAAVAVHCVAIKGAIDRLKEQVQNVE